jgi:hypothetical protein
MKPIDLRRAVLAAEVPFRLELWSGWPIVCDGPNWSVSPSGEFFTHWGRDGATVTVRASAVIRVEILEGLPGEGRDHA